MGEYRSRRRVVRRVIINIALFILAIAWLATTIVSFARGMRIKELNRKLSETSSSSKKAIIKQSDKSEYKNFCDQLRDARKINNCLVVYNSMGKRYLVRGVGLEGLSLRLEDGWYWESITWSEFEEKFPDYARFSPLYKATVVKVVEVPEQEYQELIRKAKHYDEATKELPELPELTV